MRDKVINDDMSNENKPTFIIKVLHRQNASWQGTVQWVEGGKSKDFKSALELIKLMDEVIGTESE